MEYLEEAKKLSDSLDVFLDAHKSQLQSLGVPDILHPVLWAKFEANQLGTDAYDPFEWEKIEGAAPGTPNLRIVAKKDLPPQQAVIVFPHDWTFTTKEEAKAHLESSPQLRSILSHHIRELDLISQGYVSDEEEKTELDTKAILENIYRVAFQYQVHAPPAPPSIFNFVSADPFGPHTIPFAGNGTKPVLESRIFVRTVKDPANPSKNITNVYTILFHNVNPSALNELGPSDIIKKGTSITRSEMTPMPDYSTPKYWMHHYQQSVHRNFEWFVPWAAIGPCIKSYLPTMNGVVLNPLTALTATKSKVRAFKGKPPGIEDCLFSTLRQIVFLFEQPPPCSIGAFDKATLDGLLSSQEGPQIAKKFGIAFAGKPEGRLPLIEDVIGGWEVDACMEIEIPSAALKKGSGFGVPSGGRGLEPSSAVDRCFVYVCKKVQK
ncbi:hypothetical protein BC829DRAFT_492924 [Chytridium lagenaria]|nr:hypothetical protein BC829DRAFT_492924 [Chytridium lagenaria]